MKKLFYLLALLLCVSLQMKAKSALTIGSQSITTKVELKDKRINVVAYDENNQQAYGLSYTYSGYDSNVISVASNGVITGVGVGTTHVTISFDGDDNYEAVTATDVITVTVTKQTPTLSVSAQTVAVGNTSDAVQVTATDEKGDDIEGLTYSFNSDNDSVATVNITTGAATGVANGTATITVSSAATNTFEAATATYEVTVVTANTLPNEYFDNVNMLDSRTGKGGVNSMTSHYGFFTITAHSGSNDKRTVQWSNNQFTVQNASGENTAASFTIAATGSNITIKSITLYTNLSSRSFSVDIDDVTGEPTENKGKNWKYEFTDVNSVTFTNASSGNIAVSDISIEYQLSDGIYFLPPTAEVSVNGTYNLKDNNLITQGSVGTVTFSSSDINYATVDASTGIITGVFPGQVTVTATDGTYTATCTVDITGTAGRAAWTYNDETYTLTFGSAEGWLPETIDDNPYCGIQFGSPNERQFYQTADGKAGTYAPDGAGYWHVYIENAGTPPSNGTYYVLTPSLQGKLTIKGFVNEVNSIELVASDGTVKATFTPPAANADFTWPVDNLMMGETYYLYGNTPNTPRNDGGTGWATLRLIEMTYEPSVNFEYPQTWVYNGEWFSTSTSADLETAAAQTYWAKDVNTYYNTNAYKPLNAKLEESEGQHIEVFEGDWMLYTAKNAQSIGIIPSVYVSLKADGSCITIPRVPVGFYVIVEADCTGGAGISINGRERSLDTEIHKYFYRNTVEQNVLVTATSGEMRIYSIAVVNDLTAERFEFCSATANQSEASKKNAYTVNYNWYTDDTHSDNTNNANSIVLRNPLDVPINVNVKYSFVDNNEGYFFNDSKTEYTDNMGNMTITVPKPTADTYTVIKADYSESLGLDEGQKVAYFRLAVAAKSRGGRYAPPTGTQPNTGETVIVDGMTMTFGGWRDYNNYKSSEANNYKYNGELQDSYSKSASDKKGVPLGYYGNTAGRQNPTNEQNLAYYNDQKNMFLVPCRGTYYKFEPMVDGMLTVNLLQNGILQNKPEENNFGTLSRRVLYMIDEAGENIQTITAQSGDKHYPFGVSVARLATMNIPVYILKQKNNDEILQKLKNDYDFDYEYNGLQQVKYLPQDKVVDGTNIGGGYAVVSEAVTYYSFPVKAGKTYFLFVRGSKLGMYGWEFDPTDRGTDEITEVTLSENVANPTIQVTSHAKITSFDRKINWGAWNALVLPYSMNEQQVKTIFSGSISNGANGIERELGDDVMDMVYFDRVEGNAMYFKRHYYRTIVAGKPCLIKPIFRSGVSEDEPMRTQGQGLSRGVSGKGQIDYQLVSITDTPAESTETNDSYKWSASYGTQTIKPGDYYLNASGTVIRRALTSNEVTLMGFRAFLSDESNDAASRAAIMGVGLFDATDDASSGVTGITEVVIEDENGHEVERIPANEVFDLGGKKVSNGSTEALSKGVYIKNGKKIVVK